jgi:hypothetical protein
VVRIWRLPPLSGLDDCEDRRPRVRWQRVLGVDHAGQVGGDWAVFAINCAGFCIALP